jgi:hypothetical protein
MATVEPGGPGGTPKLAPVSRWLELERASDDVPWERIVWIDDSLRGDAAAWAAAYDLPVRLVVPDPAVGLTPDDASAIVEWIVR